MSFRRSRLPNGVTIGWEGRTVAHATRDGPSLTGGKKGASMRRSLFFAGLATVWLTAGASSCVDAVIGTDSDKAATITMNTFLTACTVEKNALAAVDVYDAIHPLPPDVIAKINAADRIAEGLCPPKGALPNGVADGVSKVLQSAADIGAAYAAFTKGGQ